MANHGWWAMGGIILSLPSAVLNFWLQGSSAQLLGGRDIWKRWPWACEPPEPGPFPYCDRSWRLDSILLIYWHVEFGVGQEWRDLSSDLCLRPYLHSPKLFSCRRGLQEHASCEPALCDFALDWDVDSGAPTGRLWAGASCLWAQALRFLCHFFSHSSWAKTYLIVCQMRSKRGLQYLSSTHGVPKHDDLKVYGFCS